ncbi:hypothetical protein NEOLEDRAFT_1127310 [Neolentinus lepideus HHB14362 ss-1]|uniref:Uncharacterized protein n=1 Tax=Neolentinus lepideus HHB14362 ss-1 TaxID=1314782 RepID=A0A165VFI5_9AGAM|nr:hypothetical protein NEOLEDRAFT_1127310 [Neolentinus lepideus HHB14362 ss-1]
MPKNIIVGAGLGAESNLRDYDRFRSYDDAPWRDEIRYWGETREHWCYIGEIVEDASLGRLCLNVRDVEGAICTVAFYTNDAGESFRRSCVKGRTLVILYGKQYEFMDGRPGFRIEQEHVPFVKVRCDRL